MSFLSNNTKSTAHNIKEDEFNLSKNNPEIVGELKEKIYFTIMDNNIHKRLYWYFNKKKFFNKKQRIFFKFFK